MTSTTQKSFYLHSSQNRSKYPISDYPITHLLDRINIHCRMLKQPTYIKRFLYAFIFLLLWALFDAFFFQLQVQVYNAIFGPFHFNQKQFVEYVNQYKNDQSYLPQFGRIEYIQVELNEDNIQNSISKYDTIRRYSNPRTRDNHIATYKKITHPSIYVKLPTTSQKRFHLHHPIHFQLYSIQTLQCIVRNLPFNSAYTYRTWTEKSEYIQYINKEYEKNSTEFNKAVLTKCGVLIGFLYRPRYERGFTGRGEHTFTSDDIALNMTHSYYFFYLLLFFGLIFICLCLICLINFILYLSNIIKFELFHSFGKCLFSLKLSSDVIEELWLLNIDGFPHEQLLELDRLIKESSNKYAENLVIIRNASDDLFVVLLKMNENEGLDLTDESSPFIVCPVTDIRKMTHNNGICYGEDSSWIPWPWPWPDIVTNENEYANWLHHQLLELSDVYKQRHEQRLRYEPNSEPLRDGTHPILRLGTIEYRNTRQRRPQFKLFHPFGIWSLSLKLSPHVMEELWLLNVDGFPHEQLLELDRLIKESSNKYAENLVIIRNASDELFVVLLKMNENEGLDLTDESSPFIVCPVTDIRKMTHNNGICYGDDSSWIPWPWPWPVIVTDENEYANWLHHQLLEISDVYKQRHEQRLRYEPNSEPLQDGTHPILRLGTIEYRNTRQRRPQVNMTATHNSPLSALIHEENNNQRFKIERQTTIEYFNNLSASTSPATAEFIARFRLEHKRNQQVVNEDMMNKQIKCTPCLEDLKINEPYARWPCPGNHLFHYTCMLDSLRERNTCPNCRHEVEDTPIE
ncbi:unnamed protein product [Adineta steineri]|uniref:RING-type domain-containing protein n=1 Tax=Adineta steineri TaxID=433720 RepID=A0A814AHP0_9BILA|nr:unnamed protein product [Adineta steineri]